MMHRSLAIDIIVPREKPRRWQDVLIRRLAADGHDIAVLHDPGARPWPGTANALVALERVIFRRRGEGLAAPLNGILRPDSRAGTRRGVLGVRFAFYWIGGRGKSMLGIWEVGTAPQRMNLHVAFRADVQDLLHAPSRLRSANMVPLDFQGEPTDEPVVLAWMPACLPLFP